MIKKLLIGSAVYFSVIGATTIANELSKEDKAYINKIEIDNTCDDLLEYLQVDLEESRIDSITFESYIWNINEIKRRNNE